MIATGQSPATRESLKVDPILVPSDEDMMDTEVQELPNGATGAINVKNDGGAAKVPTLASALGRSNHTNALPQGPAMPGTKAAQMNLLTPAQAEAACLQIERERTQAEETRLKAQEEDRIKAEKESIPAENTRRKAQK
jgi:hypothetical protein